MMKKFNSLSDKDIYDALQSGNISLEEIHELFLKRGILISSDTDRSQLATLFSRLPHTYSDYEDLRLFSTSTRREKFTTFSIKNIQNIDTIRQLFEDSKNDINDNDFKIDCSKRDQNSLSIVIDYMITNFSKSEIKKRVEKRAIVSILKKDDLFFIRRPINEKIDSFFKKEFMNTFEKYRKNDDSSVEFNEVSLEDFPDNKKRTNFFINLINDIDNHDLYDVLDVYFAHPDQKDRNYIKHQEKISQDDDLGLGTHISKGSLIGTGILESKKYSDFIDSGFYIVKIIWKTIEKNVPDPDIYEFEAEMRDSKNFKEFCYLVKGSYKWKSVTEYRNKKILTDDDESIFNSIIERAAFKSISTVIDN